MRVRHRRRTRTRESLVSTVGSNPFFTAVLFAVILATVGMLLANWIRRQGEIDQCLDAGGCWIHAEGRCTYDDAESCRS